MYTYSIEKSIQTMRFNPFLSVTIGRANLSYLIQVIEILILEYPVQAVSDLRKKIKYTVKAE